MSAFGTMGKQFAELAVRLAEIERRQNGMFRHGTVEQVDPEKALVRLRIGGTEQEPFISPWVPYGQIAGALKVHTPPSKGQQMTMMSPTGDFRQAIALPMTWSDQNPSPSQSGEEHVLTFGDVRLTLTSDSLAVKVGEVSMTISEEGVKFKGGEITHDDVKIDKSHVHTDVQPGGGLTGVPQS